MKKSFLLMGFATAMLSMNVRAAEEETVLHKQMETMNDAYKVMRKETDPVKGAALAKEALELAIKSTAEIPVLVKDIKDPAEQAKALVGYRKMMGKMIISFCEIEEAFQANKIDDVTKLIDALKELKKEGHEKYKPKDE